MACAGPFMAATSFPAGDSNRPAILLSISARVGIFAKSSACAASNAEPSRKAPLISISETFFLHPTSSFATSTCARSTSGLRCRRARRSRSGASRTPTSWSKSRPSPRCRRADRGQTPVDKSTSSGSDPIERSKADCEPNGSDPELVVRLIHRGLTPIKAGGSSCPARVARRSARARRHSARAQSAR